MFSQTQPWHRRTTGIPSCEETCFVQQCWPLNHILWCCLHSPKREVDINTQATSRQLEALSRKDGNLAEQTRFFPSLSTEQWDLSKDSANDPSRITLVHVNIEATIFTPDSKLEMTLCIVRQEKTCRAVDNPGKDSVLCLLYGYMCFRCRCKHIFPVAGIKPRAWCIPGKCSTVTTLLALLCPVRDKWARLALGKYRNY